MSNTQCDGNQHRNQIFFDLSVQLHTVVRLMTDSNVPDAPISKIIVVLGIQQPCSLKRLCNILGISTSSGSLTIDRYVKMGLIERHQDQKDRRKIVLSLTEQGNKVANETYQLLFKKMNELFDELSEEENCVFCDALHTIESTLEKIHPFSLAD